MIVATTMRRMASADGLPSDAPVSCILSPRKRRSFSVTEKRRNELRPKATHSRRGHLIRNFEDSARDAIWPPLSCRPPLGNKVTVFSGIFPTHTQLKCSRISSEIIRNLKFVNGFSSNLWMQTQLSPFQRCLYSFLVTLCCVVCLYQ